MTRCWRALAMARCCRMRPAAHEPSHHRPWAVQHHPGSWPGGVSAHWRTALRRAGHALAAHGQCASGPGAGHGGFCITGADVTATLDGQPLAAWRSHTARAGQELHIGRIRGGAAYLCVQGGFALAPVLGSLSTYTRAGLGGFEGRRLDSGDLLPLAVAEAPAGPERLLPHPVPAERSRPLRVLLGPHAEMFTEAAIRTLLSEAYQVTHNADRLGIRLQGTPLEHAGAKEIVSDGNNTGCMQVPGDGQPILLMPDRQTAGGYPKIATVITADLHRLGQVLPGSQLRFEAVAPEQAEMVAWQLECAISASIGSIQDLA
ncbi:MAG: biotin-dependent carboxyltransferase [Alphaproteobacteria bacterium]|nr:biotin-dependent carboxyltransferase [Alphaproteobacteria bacterium]